MLAQEVLAAVLQPILNIISEISEDEYETIILPRFRCVTKNTHAHAPTHTSPLLASFGKCRVWGVCVGITVKRR